MLSLQRCSVNQASENNEMFDSLAPAKGILLGLLISTLFWTCLGLAIRRLDSARCRPWHAGRLARFVQTDYSCHKTYCELQKTFGKDGKDLPRTRKRKKSSAA